MIDINEMIIGSIVKMSDGSFQGNAEPGDVVRYDIEDFEHCREDCFDPVPLTRKWRNKLGVDKIPYYEFNGTLLMLVNPLNGSSLRVREVVYVHEMQLIHLGLTGQQLKIKEDGVD